MAIRFKESYWREPVWCDRMAFPYEQIKRQAEYALWQEYSDRNWLAVRYPFAIGKDDYTKRLLFYVEHVKGAINGSAFGTISIREILDYIEKKTGHAAILSDDGEEAPYNGEPEYSINTEKATALGYRFSNLKDWIYELLDYYLAGFL